MSYGWEARWIRKRYKMGEGLEVETCQDLTSGLIVCPLCVDISHLCPSFAEPSTASVSIDAIFFFSSEDLFHHMKAHVKAGEWSKHISSEVEEEGEEYVEGEGEEDLATDDV
ncbi:MAG: hypothetical protein QW101_03790 [Ignisphaera sp.]|uniref:Uncharacterized protein n=1 Tax=Ignisphaera aggregans TaxID=334771 RepID=A0A7J3MZZ4_9CREN